MGERILVGFGERLCSYQSDLVVEMSPGAKIVLSMISAALALAITIAFEEGYIQVVTTPGDLRMAQ